MKCGNLMQQRITRIQTEQANEIARLIKQYITIDQRMKGVPVAQVRKNEHDSRFFQRSLLFS